MKPRKSMAAVVCRCSDYITLPLLRPILLVVLVYETMTAILTFDIVYVLTGGGPADSTSLISWFAYAEIFKSLNLGAGIALSIIIAVNNPDIDHSLHAGTEDRGYDFLRTAKR